MTFVLTATAGYVPYCSTSVTPLLVTVRFQPVTVGPVTGTLRAEEAAVPNFDVPLTGTGIYGTSIPVTEKDYDTDMKDMILNQYRTRS